MDHTAKINIDTKTLVLCALIIIGLVLTFVGLFGSILKFTDGNTSISLSISQLIVLKENKVLDNPVISVTNVFGWCTFGFVIATVVVAVATMFIENVNGGKLVGFFGFFAALFATLFFIFSFVTASNCLKVPDYGNISVAFVSFGPLLTLFGALLVSFPCLLLNASYPITSSTLFHGTIALSGFVLATVGLSGTFLKIQKFPLSISGVSFLKKILEMIREKTPELSSYKTEAFAAVGAFSWIVFFLSLICLFFFFVKRTYGKELPGFLAGSIGLITITFAVLVLTLSIVTVVRINAIEGNETNEKIALLSYAPFLLLFGGLFAGVEAVSLSVAAQPQSAPVPKLVDKTDDTLQKMSDLVDAGVLSKEQFEEKKKELEKQKKKLRADENIDENLVKLEELFDAGILSQEDFETKKKELEKRRIELAEQKRGAQAIGSVDENLVKLKELFDAGILSQEDFESKKLELEEKKHKLSAESLTFDEIIAALKQLKELVEAGVISEEELEKKRTEYKPLKKLRGMLDTGILTQEEYEEKKTELLNVLGEG